MAHEIGMDRIAITNDGEVFLRLLTRTLSSSDMYGYQDVQLQPYKLNVYPTGGHFKLHQDTPRKNVVGSL